MFLNQKEYYSISKMRKVTGALEGLSLTQGLLSSCLGAVAGVTSHALSLLDGEETY